MGARGRAEEADKTREGICIPCQRPPQRRPQTAGQKEGLGQLVSAGPVVSRPGAGPVGSHTNKQSRQVFPG